MKTTISSCFTIFDWVFVKCRADHCCSTYLCTSRTGRDCVHHTPHHHHWFNFTSKSAYDRETEIEKFDWKIRTMLFPVCVVIDGHRVEKLKIFSFLNPINLLTRKFNFKIYIRAVLVEKIISNSSHCVERVFPIASPHSQIEMRDELNFHSFTEIPVVFNHSLENSSTIRNVQ